MIKSKGNNNEFKNVVNIRKLNIYVADKNKDNKYSDITNIVFFVSNLRLKTMKKNDIVIIP